MEGSKEMKCSWGAIVLTCRKRQSAFAFQRGKAMINSFSVWLSNIGITADITAGFYLRRERYERLT